MLTEDLTVDVRFWSACHVGAIETIVGDQVERVEADRLLRAVIGLAKGWAAKDLITERAMDFAAVPGDVYVGDRQFSSAFAAIHLIGQEILRAAIGPIVEAWLAQPKIYRPIEQAAKRNGDPVNMVAPMLQSRFVHEFCAGDGLETELTVRHLPTLRKRVGKLKLPTPLDLENLFQRAVKEAASSPSTGVLEFDGPRSPAEWAKIFKLCWPAIKRRIDSRRIRAERVTSKAWKICRDDLPSQQ